MLKNYFLRLLKVSVLLWIVLTIGVLTSSILDVFLSRNGISEYSSLTISLVTLIALLILGLGLIPKSLLKFKEVGGQHVVTQDETTDITKDESVDIFHVRRDTNDQDKYAEKIYNQRLVAGKQVLEEVKLSHSQKHLGAYRLINVIGYGGYATIYLGEHIFLGRLVAIKILDSKTSSVLGQDDLLVNIGAFANEARITASLNHKNIIRILNFDIDNNIPYIVMDYADRGSLDRQHPLGEILHLSTVVDYIKQIASGLQYVHDHNVVHCDVKPANLLMDHDGTIMVSDFGLARVQSKVNGQNDNEVMGTPVYMAPEHIMGYPVPASDQYSLAAVAWQWLTGDYLFTGDMSYDILRQQMYRDPSTLGQLHPISSLQVARVLLKALSKNPTKRYVTIWEFAKALEKASQTPVRLR